MPPVPAATGTTRLLAATALALALAGCGAPPGPGPTAAQLSARLRDRPLVTVATADHKELACPLYQARRPNPQRAAFLYLHGIESHSGWFDRAATLLAARGFPVYCLDRRGSGINRENRGHPSGHAPRGIDLTDDVDRAVAMLRADRRFDRIYLIGLSWGGKYALAYDATHPHRVDGLVLVTPGLMPRVDMPLPTKLAALTDYAFAPRRQHPIPITPEMFTTTPEHLRYIRHDPLRLHTVSAGFLRQSLRMDHLAKRRPAATAPPLLVFLAGHDRIIDNHATRQFLAANPQRPTTLIEYPDQTHSIQLDAPERLVRDIINWAASLPAPR